MPAPISITARHFAKRALGIILRQPIGELDPLTDVVVTRIVELAKAGQRDPEVLCIDVLAALGTSSDHATQRPPPKSRTSSSAASAERLAVLRAHGLPDGFGSSRTSGCEANSVLFSPGPRR
jgi:hypothetical protein